MSRRCGVRLSVDAGDAMLGSSRHPSLPILRVPRSGGRKKVESDPSSEERSRDEPGHCPVEAAVRLFHVDARDASRKKGYWDQESRNRTNRPEESGRGDDRHEGRDGQARCQGEIPSLAPRDEPGECHRESEGEKGRCSRSGRLKHRDLFDSQRRFALRGRDRNSASRRRRRGHLDGNLSSFIGARRLG